MFKIIFHYFLFILMLSNLDGLFSFNTKFYVTNNNSYPNMRYNMQANGYEYNNVYNSNSSQLAYNFRKNPDLSNGVENSNSIYLNNTNHFKIGFHGGLSFLFIDTHDLQLQSPDPGINLFKYTLDNYITFGMEFEYEFFSNIISSVSISSQHAFAFGIRMDYVKFGWKDNVGAYSQGVVYDIYGNATYIVVLPKLKFTFFRYLFLDFGLAFHIMLEDSYGVDFLANTQNKDAMVKDVFKNFYVGIAPGIGVKFFPAYNLEISFTVQFDMGIQNFVNDFYYFAEKTGTIDDDDFKKYDKNNKVFFNNLKFTFNIGFYIF